MARKVHSDLCKKNKLDWKETWYECVPEGTLENEEVKLLWDIHFHYDNLKEARTPDIAPVDNIEHKGIIVDISVPAELSVGEKESGKVESTRN